MSEPIEPAKPAIEPAVEPAVESQFEPAARQLGPDVIVIGAVVIILALFLGAFILMVTWATITKQITIDEAKALCTAVIPAPAILIGIGLFAI